MTKFYDFLPFSRRLSFFVTSIVCLLILQNARSAHDTVESSFFFFFLSNYFRNGISTKLDLRDSLPWYFTFVRNLRHYLLIGPLCCRLFQFHLISFLGNNSAECSAINLVGRFYNELEERKNETYCFLYYCLSNMQF